jgi:hypothetical protein
MTSTPIPRALVAEIIHRHGDYWLLDDDPPAHVVRGVATDLRTGESADIAEADELDALVDRIEREEAA